MGQQQQASTQADEWQPRSRSQSQSQTQGQGSGGLAPNPGGEQSVPGEDPGTLTDEDYLVAGGPDSLDSVSPDEHPDSRPGSLPQQGEDSERAGGGVDRSQSI